jgi:hypothetical protein
VGEDWALEQDIERARDGIDSLAGDGSTEREAFERVAANARAAPHLLAALEQLAGWCPPGSRGLTIHFDDVAGGVFARDVEHARAAIAKAKASKVIAP